jgi:curved DNA-binding protein CbpA
VTAESDPYKVLQVDPEAEDEVIQAAYRRLAQKYHPDRAPDADAMARMVAINAAWELLRDPGRRAAHDRERAASWRSPSEYASPTRPAPTSARPPQPTSTTAQPGAGSGRERPPETMSGDWTSGRSSTGSGYDPRTMRSAEGLGAAGPPPGNPTGTVLGFGRYSGWSLGEIARRDIGYLEWLDRMAIGRQYRDEIDAILRRAGRRRSVAAEAADRRGLFRRR